MPKAAAPEVVIEPLLVIDDVAAGATEARSSCPTIRSRATAGPGSRRPRHPLHQRRQSRRWQRRQERRFRHYRLQPGLGEETVGANA